MPINLPLDSEPPDLGVRAPQPSLAELESGAREHLWGGGLTRGLAAWA